MDEKLKMVVGNFLWALGVVLVNAYVAYIATNVFTWKKKRSELISHYKFRKQIALALICPKLYGGKPSDDNDNDNTEEAKTTATATMTGRPTKKQRTNTSFTTRRQLAQETKSKRSVRVNDKTLDPINGDLACRLKHDLDHFPDNNYDKKQMINVKCAMHRWYNRDIQKKDNILICSTCQVALCKYCYKAFHKEHDIERLRAHVANMCQKCD